MCCIFVLQSFRNHCKGIIHLRNCNNKGIDPDLPLREAFGDPEPEPKPQALPTSSSDAIQIALATLSRASQCGPLASLLAAQKHKQDQQQRAVSKAIGITPVQKQQQPQQQPAPKQQPQQPATKQQPQQPAPKQRTYYCSSCHITLQTRDVSIF